MAPTQKNFDDALQGMLQVATEKGRAYLDVNAGDLHRRVGGYPSQHHRMPVCCSIMRRTMLSGDQVLQQPPKGQGASLVIRYHLPR